MSKMRAVQVVGYHQNLEMTEVQAPTPSGPFDVIVKIGGAGVCRTDLHILEGQWAEKTQVQLPYTIGHENAGWVHAVGSAVTNAIVQVLPLSSSAGGSMQSVHAGSAGLAATGAPTYGSEPWHATLALGGLLVLAGGVVIWRRHATP